MCLHYDALTKFVVTCLVCLNNNIRLQGGGSLQGQVEICINGAWESVCSNSWDNLDAIVVCTQLGLDYTGKPRHCSSYTKLISLAQMLFPCSMALWVVMEFGQEMFFVLATRPS